VIKLLFYVSKLYSIPVVSPVFLEAKRRGIPAAFYVSRKVSLNLPEVFFSAPVYTDLSHARRFAPDFVLCPGNFVDFRLPGRKVQLFHGIGVEKPSHYRIRHFFDYYLTSGPVVTERFRMLESKYRYFKTFETGWPKIDHIMNYPRENLRGTYSIPHHSRVILYAPTHSAGMESASALINVIDGQIGRDEIWFCKPHEFMNRELLHQIRQTGARVIEHYDITPYLHLADVLIGDTSSVVYEFMALDKPVVTYRTAGRADKGIDIQHPEELRAALDRSLARPDEFSLQRRKHLLEVNPVRDGTISRTILELLSSLDPAVSPGNRRKPLNLFRKMQIVYHSCLRKGYLR